MPPSPASGSLGHIYFQLQMTAQSPERRVNPFSKWGVEHKRTLLSPPSIGSCGVNDTGLTPYQLKTSQRDTTDSQWNEGGKRLTQSWALCGQVGPLTLWRTAIDKHSSLCDNPESQAKNSSVTKVCYPIFYFYTRNQIWIMALLLSINVWRHGGNSGSSFLLELWSNNWQSLKVGTSPSWEACSLSMSNWAGLLVGGVAVEAGNVSWH